MVSIYGLFDPRNNELRYIGKTKVSLEKRLYNHIYNKDNSNKTKSNWINDLKSHNLKPIMKLIKETDNNNWEYWEKYYIDYYTQKGSNLLNILIGGKSALRRDGKPRGKIFGITPKLEGFEYNDIDDSDEILMSEYNMDKTFLYEKSNSLKDDYFDLEDSRKELAKSIKSYINSKIYGRHIFTDIQRQVFNLCFIESLKVSQIAKIINKAPQSILTTKNIIIMKIKERYNGTV